MIKSLRIYSLLLFFLLTCVSAMAAEREGSRLAISTNAEGLDVTVDGELFAGYRNRSGSKPVIWPIIGPTGSPVTRAYPVAERGPHEEADHPHHRSLWFGYEGINGVDFWHEPEATRTRPLPIGSVQHREFLRADSDGQIATVVTRNDYLDDAGRTVAHDERLMQFGAEPGKRWIDFKIRLWSSDRPLKLRETKEGAFAMRVAGTMKVDASMGGRIVNSNGDQDKKAWGKPAAWVDYSGPVEGETVGIAILTHPSNQQPTPCWHVRPYGLFAANPYGTASYGQPGQGGVEFPAGQPIRLRFRVLLHTGDHDQGDVAVAFRQYASTP